MSSGQREARLGVIEGGWQPGRSRMTAAAAGAELAAMGVILGMARVAVG